MQPVSDAFFRPKRVWDILKETHKLYFWHYGRYIVPLLLPVAYMLIGSYVGIYVSYALADVLDHHPPKFLGDYYPLVSAGLVFLSFFPFGYLVIKGFGEYLLYLVSMNLNARADCCETPLTFREPYLTIRHHAKTYSLLFVWATLVLALPLGTCIIPFLLHSFLAWLIPLACVILITVISVYCSLLFQVFAFEPEQSSFYPMIHSAKLVHNQILRVIPLYLLLILVTNWVFPSLAVWFFDGTRLVVPIQWIEGNLLNFMLERLKPDMTNFIQIFPNTMIPTVVAGYRYLMAHQDLLSQQAAETTVNIASSLLFLPWGTIMFALLYGDLQARYWQENLASLSEPVSIPSPLAGEG